MTLLMWVEMVTFESSLWEAGPEASLSSYPILPVCVWHFYVIYSLHTFFTAHLLPTLFIGVFWLSSSLYTFQDVQFFAVPYTCSCLGTFLNTCRPPMYYATYFSLVGHIDHMLTEKKLMHCVWHTITVLQNTYMCSLLTLFQHAHIWVLGKLILII